MKARQNGIAILYDFWSRCQLQVNLSESIVASQRSRRLSKKTLDRNFAQPVSPKFLLLQILLPFGANPCFSSSLLNRGAWAFIARRPTKNCRVPPTPPVRTSGIAGSFNCHQHAWPSVDHLSTAIPCRGAMQVPLLSLP